MHITKGFFTSLRRMSGVCIWAICLYPPVPASVVASPLARVDHVAETDRTITGTVLAKDGNTPVPGVTVVVKGTNQGTTTNAEGKFTIEITGSSAVLVFSAVGYVTQEQETGNAGVVDILLATDLKTLNEVVVVGYGTQKKRDLTGAVSQVNATRLENENPQSVQDVLRGNVPGMNVGFSTSAKGGGSVSVRGQNSVNAGSSPLIVLDGTIYYGGLEDINPNDIETIDVLKDASSSAVFGAKAASGVILITTKKGKEGKPVININSNFGFAGVAKNQPVLSPQVFVSWRQEVMRNINARTLRRSYPSSGGLNP